MSVRDRLFQFKEEFRDVKPESFNLVVEAIAELDALAEEIRLKEVALGIATYQRSILVAGLEFYADPTTWVRLPPQTLAAVVKGKKAEEALREAGAEVDG